VKIEGQAATRLTDKMLQNHGNTMTTGEQQAEVFGTVDDKEVQWWIDDAMAWCANPGRTREQVIDCAWSHLKEQRKPPNCHDANLAAAEHYMYSRKMIAEWPLPNAVLEAYPLGYEALKVALYGTGFVIGIPFEILGVSGDPSFFLGDLFLNLPATGDCPVSPPSLGSLRWGNKGIDDEMAARKQ